MNATAIQSFRDYLQENGQLGHVEEIFRNVPNTYMRNQVSSRNETATGTTEQSLQQQRRFSWTTGKYDRVSAVLQSYNDQSSPDQARLQQVRTQHLRGTCY